MQIRLAGVEPESIVDGPGYRTAVFCQGCPHGCPGCHNPATHDYAGGYQTDTADVIETFGRNPLVRGVTLTGGEPMTQAAAMAEIAAAAKQKGLNVWCYTGYTLEQLLAGKDPDCMALLEAVDVLVDGPYLAHERSLDLLYCGSRNQRLIDMPATLKAGEIRLYVPPAW
ncbi:MAG: anaerobic ribonucleoside-triphosphate reductase activating protein [Clostridia bacterium]|nr:anaerobic ribonucleoside-triphosphate reductase activating protein [Clostridia bacterium]MBQ7053428.1 anaerobic ribonucleoside-triphosphate reductase activating protein [Clostridia bacterium]